MISYGLIGYPLEHSFSRDFFAEKFRREGLTGFEYLNFELGSIDLLPDLLAYHPTLAGFNVTAPYKESVISFLDGIDREAAEIGAVNCVVAEPDSGRYPGADGGCSGSLSCKGSGKGEVKLTGYNTDAPAFRDSLLGFIGSERPSALVLGSGGASRAVCHVLRGLGIGHTIVSRTPKAGALGYADVTETTIAENLLIINTTPLGAWPHVNDSPEIPYESLSPRHFLFDLVYNPDPTEFLLRGKAYGAQTLNGMGMLVGQAERSWEIWRTRKCSG